MIKILNTSPQKEKNNNFVFKNETINFIFYYRKFIICSFIINFINLQNHAIVHQQIKNQFIYKIEEYYNTKIKQITINKLKKKKKKVQHEIEIIFIIVSRIM